jgi:hypothetical protein
VIQNDHTPVKTKIKAVKSESCQRIWLQQISCQGPHDQGQQSFCGDREMKMRLLKNKNRKPIATDLWQIHWASGTNILLP